MWLLPWVILERIFLFHYHLKKHPYLSMSRDIFPAPSTWKFPTHHTSTVFTVAASLKLFISFHYYYTVLDSPNDMPPPPPPGPDGDIWIPGATYPFLSKHILDGPPPDSWQTFVNPLMRRCRFEILSIDCFIGYGYDGCVFKASNNEGSFAVKVVRIPTNSHIAYKVRSSLKNSFVHV